MRQPFADTLTQLLDGLGAGAADAGLRLSLVRIDLPLEIVITGDGDGPVLLGEAPRWRWRTAFDLEPGRLRLVCMEAGR